jgi:hypothetical protein
MIAPGRTPKSCSRDGSRTRLEWDGSGASLLKCMFLSGEKPFADFRRPGARQNFRSGGCFSGYWFEVELLFLDFLCRLNAANRCGRRLESLASEHRPASLLYPAMILLDYVVQILARSYPYAAWDPIRGSAVGSAVYL